MCMYVLAGLISILIYIYIDMTCHHFLLVFTFNSGDMTCLYVPTHIHVHTCTHECTRARTSAHVHKYTVHTRSTYTHTLAHAHTHKHKCTHKNAHTQYVHTLAQMHTQDTHTHTQTQTHTHTHAYTHTRIRLHSCTQQTHTNTHNAQCHAIIQTQTQIQTQTIEVKDQQDWTPRRSTKRRHCYPCQQTKRHLHLFLTFQLQVGVEKEESARLPNSWRCRGLGSCQHTARHSICDHAIYLSLSKWDCKFRWIRCLHQNSVHIY